MEPLVKAWQATRSTPRQSLRVHPHAGTPVRLGVARDGMDRFADEVFCPSGIWLKIVDGAQASAVATVWVCCSFFSGLTISCRRSLKLLSAFSNYSGKLIINMCVNRSPDLENVPQFENRVRDQKVQ